MFPSAIHPYIGDDLASNLALIEEHVPGLSDCAEAVMFCDLSDVQWKWRFWHECLPNVTPFYAVKCNNDPMFLSLLVSLGAGFDCASMAEVAAMLELNVDVSRLIFAQPVKYVPHLKFARQHNVDLMTFDRLAELIKIRDHYPEARLMLRICYDAKDVLFRMGDKFGCDPEREAPALLREAKAMHLNVVGISFHVGTGCNDPDTFRDALIAVKKLISYGNRELGYRMDVVDIGGGFHGTRDSKFTTFARIINDALRDHYEEGTYSCIAEPGQFFSTSAFTLFATVMGARYDEAEGAMVYTINDGVFNSFRSCPEILHFLKIEAVHRHSERNGSNNMLSIILGQCMDERDLITRSAQLPKLSVGDLIVFRNIGSYSLSMQTSFSKFKNPTVKYFMRQADLDHLNL